jgi:hypothetical protein
VELFEKPGISESDVIITFINPEDSENIDLQARGITPEEARNLRNRLRALKTIGMRKGWSFMTNYKKVDGALKTTFGLN